MKFHICRASSRKDPKCSEAYKSDQIDQYGYPKYYIELDPNKIIELAEKYGDLIIQLKKVPSTYLGSYQNRIENEIIIYDSYFE